MSVFVLLAGLHISLYDINHAIYPAITYHWAQTRMMG